MNKTVLVILLGAGGWLTGGMPSGRAMAQSGTDTAPPASKTKSKSAAKKADSTIPAGAVKDGDHYRYVDSDGKTWIYRQTPFGVKKLSEDEDRAANAHRAGSPSPAGSTAASEANAPQAGAAPDRSATITAVREGDIIHFAKPGPFGVSKWDKKINDLTPDEQKAFDREQAKGKE